MDSLYFREPLGLLIELSCYKFFPPFGYSYAEVLQKHKLKLKEEQKTLKTKMFP